ncbi:MAG: hypothetical protein SF182_15030 [Deltaproteobacteria bacterium]|nr:hypothetical protein [Deltaproteobacteria bacterium]
MRVASIGTAVILSCGVLLWRAPLAAQCVGDCAGDGEVTINDLILGVNIALGSAPVSACEAFANNQGEVTIAQLIQGVNNALGGCPEPVATPTATATATDTVAPPTATHTDTPLPPTITATRTQSPSRTATETRTATVTRTITDTPTETATVSATPTATGPTPTPTSGISCTENDDCPLGNVCVDDVCLAATPTETPPVSPTASATPTATSTGAASPTATATVVASATHTASPSATDTATPPSPTPTTPAAATATASVTHTATVTATLTRTPTVTVPPTFTPLPPGQAIGGRAAFVSAGLGGIQALVGAVAAILNNDGGALTFGVGGPADVDQCPISGTTSQTCVKDPSTVVHLSLGAYSCVAAGPAGGTVNFDGGIAFDSSAFFLNSCSPPLFVFANFATDELSVQFFNAGELLTYAVAADLDGTVGLGLPIDPSCTVGSLTLVLNGTLTSTLADGTGVTVSFFATNVAISAITYNADCVPIAYTLTFNGPAAFTPMFAPALNGPAGIPSEDQFSVTFTNFVLKQNASSNPVQVEMSGSIASDCFGGAVSMTTFAPIAIAAGDICPDAGQLNVTGSGNSMATVVYDDGMVQVTPSGGQPVEYPFCFAPELLMCQPQ